MPKRLKFIGVRNGKRWWDARITWRDPDTGQQAIDTTYRFEADTQAKAEAKREKRLQDLIAIHKGEGRPDMTLGALVEEWFATVESRGSRMSWGSHVNSKIVPTWKRVRLDRVTARKLQRWLDNLEGPRGPLSYRTVNSVRDCLTHAYRYGIRKGYCAENVAAQTERRRRPRPRADQEIEEPPRRSLTAEQVPGFFEALKQVSDGEYFALVATQLALGCRFGEVSALKVSDVDWSSGEVVIRRSQTRGVVGPPKSRYARRAVLGATALQLLKTHRAKMLSEQRPGWSDGWLFPRVPSPRKSHGVHQSISTLGHVLKRVYAQIGADPQGRTHVMRHTMHNIARQKVSESLLRRVVGHSSAEMTDTYSHTERDELRVVGEVIDELL